VPSAGGGFGLLLKRLTVAVVLLLIALVLPAAQGISQVEDVSFQPPYRSSASVTQCSEGFLSTACRSAVESQDLSTGEFRMRVVGGPYLEGPAVEQGWASGSVRFHVEKIVPSTADVWTYTAQIQLDPSVHGVVGPGALTLPSPEITMRVWPGCLLCPPNDEESPIVSRTLLPAGAGLDVAEGLYELTWSQPGGGKHRFEIEVEAKTYWQTGTASAWRVSGFVLGGNAIGWEYDDIAIGAVGIKAPSPYGSPCSVFSCAAYEDDPLTIVTRVETSGTVALPYRFDVALDGALIASEAVGELGTQVREYEVPALPAGDHAVTLRIDPDGTVAEDREDNNELTKTFTIHVDDTPDLVVERIKMTPTRPKAGDDVSYLITVANRGDTGVESFFLGGAAWDCEPTKCTPFMVFDEQQSPLGAGNSTDIRIKDVARSGPWSLRVQAYGYGVEESNRTNNILDASFTPR
jgi:hypothetical protein